MAVGRCWVRGPDLLVVVEGDRACTAVPNVRAVATNTYLVTGRDNIYDAHQYSSSSSTDTPWEWNAHHIACDTTNIIYYIHMTFSGTYSTVWCRFGGAKRIEKLPNIADGLGATKERPRGTKILSYLIFRLI